MNGLRMYHLYPFFKKKKKKEDPPPMRKEKNLLHHGDRSFEGKNDTHFFGGRGGSTRTQAQNATFASVFQKFSRGDPPPPPPPAYRIAGR